MALIGGVSVNQSGAHANGDMVGGNKLALTFTSNVGTSSTIASLHLKLKQEVEADTKTQKTVSALNYFTAMKPKDVVVGLEAKLSFAQRPHEIHSALDKKELFAQFLEEWSLYASAQEIFACFLAKIEHEFTFHILPVVDGKDQVAMNALITERVVKPTIEECGCGAFNLNHAIVMGMIYWLAEKCFVSWHK